MISLGISFVPEDYEIEQDLFDFLPADPKTLAYFLSGVNMLNNPTTDNLKNAKDFVQNNIYELNDNGKIEHLSPNELSALVSKYLHLSREEINEVISSELNPGLITADVVIKSLKGLSDYLQYLTGKDIKLAFVWS